MNSSGKNCRFYLSFTRAKFDTCAIMTGSDWLKCERFDWLRELIRFALDTVNSNYPLSKYPTR